MGSGTFNTQSYTRSYSHATTNFRDVGSTFEARGIKAAFDPAKIKMRESCDSPDHPNSTPLILSLDVTGSMGNIPYKLLACGGLGRLMDHIYGNSTIPDPQIMTVAIGDVASDNAPLQATQFESDNRIAEQLKDIFIEQGGGGNGTESYDLTWLFAARYTKIDSFDKRGKKGYLFTIGDEGVPRGASGHQLAGLFGNSDYEAMSAKRMLEDAQVKWECFHLLIEETGFARDNIKRLRSEWDAFMGRHVIHVQNSEYIPEIIVAVLEISEGKNPEEVILAAKDEKIRQAIEYALN